jgi:hypothetical protein
LTVPDDLQELGAATLDGIAAPSELAEDLDRCLWVLFAALTLMPGRTLTAHEVSVVLRHGPRISVSRQRVQGLLDANRGLAHRQRRAGRQTYEILHDGIERLKKQGASDVLLIDPSQALTYVRSVQALFGASQGLVKLCDPYLGPRSLDFLSTITAASELRVLTDRVERENAVRRDLKALRSQMGYPVEIRRVGSHVLHDRYLIDRGGMLLIGTSLNGLGLKQSMVVRVGNDLRLAAEQGFDALWSSGTAL